ncbi:unnamed protein product, partial [Brenthis ino]
MNGSYENSRKRQGKVLLRAVTPKSEHSKLWAKAKRVLKTIKFVNKKGRESSVPSVTNWIRTIENIELLKNRHDSLFDGTLGRYTGPEVQLHLREGASPVFCRARPVPYALRARVEAELDAMLRAGVIEPVARSDWATPLVIANPTVDVSVPPKPRRTSTLIIPEKSPVEPEGLTAPPVALSPVPQPSSPSVTESEKSQTETELFPQIKRVRKPPVRLGIDEFD